MFIKKEKRFAVFEPFFARLALKFEKDLTKFLFFIY
jgi:hypothetical protein